jgi:hypothetical protein
MATTKIRSSSITDGQVANADLSATVAVTGGQIADNAITLAKMAGGTDGNLITYDASGDPAHVATGSATHVLTSNGAGAAPTFQAALGGLFSSYAVIVDQKSTTTDGGTFTAGAWQTRDLNTEIADPDGIVTITANQFILGAGTYFIRWSAPAAAGIDYNTFIYRHQSRLYDVTGTAEVEPGSPEYLGFYGVGVIGATNRSVGVARVAPSGANTYSIQHKCGTTMSALGFGVAGDFTVEEYTIVEIYKES